MQLIGQIGWTEAASQVHLHDGRLINRQRCKACEGTAGCVNACGSTAVHCQLLHQREHCNCACANEVVRPLLCRSCCQHLPGPLPNQQTGQCVVEKPWEQATSIVYAIQISVGSLTLSRYAAAASSSGSPWYSGSRAASTSASPLFSSMALHMLVKTSVQKAELAADIWYSASAAASLVLAESALRSFTSLSTPPVPTHRGCGEVCYTTLVHPTLCMHCGVQRGKQWTTNK